MGEKLKVVTLIIKASRLRDEQENVLLFKTNRKGRNAKLIMFPKKCMYNFEKVITHFPHWRHGRVKEKAFKFDIPLWLYDKKKDGDIYFLGEDVLVENTHK